MKIKDMKEMIESRKNLVGFLHFSEILKIEGIVGNAFKAGNKSFKRLSNEIITMYKCKKISNKKVSEALDIIFKANTHFRIESHRHDAYGSILEYDIAQKAYLFMKKGSYREFLQLNSYID